MSTKTIHRVLFAFVVTILLLASFFAGRMHTQPVNVQAQEITEDEDRAILTHTCKVVQVAMYDNRAHILCDSYYGATTIRFYAIANTPANKTLINRVIAIGLTQKSMNQNVTIHFDSLSSNNPPGCYTSDCRLLVGIVGSN